MPKIKVQTTMLYGAIIRVEVLSPVWCSRMEAPLRNSFCIDFQDTLWADLVEKSAPGKTMQLLQPYVIEVDNLQELGYDSCDTII